MFGIAACLFFLFVVEQCSAVTGAIHFNDPEERLKKHLLDGYDKTIRPGVIQNGVKQPLLVNVYFAPYRIIGLDEKLETMSLLTYIVEIWQDPRLVWDPTEFGGMTLADFRVDSVWTTRSYFPNLVVLNQDDKTSLRSVKVSGNVTESDAATVVLITYALLQERCKFDMTYYPFDRQTCNMCVTPTQYSMADLVYNASYYPMEFPVDGGEWDLEQTSTFNMTLAMDTLACLRLTAQRRSLYYIVNLFVPTLCICILNTIGLFASIDADLDELEFANLGQTTLLSLSVLLLTVADQTPRGSLTVSLMGMFFLGTIFQTLAAAVTAVYLRKWHKRNKGTSRNDIYPRITTASDVVKTQAEKKWIRCCMALHLSMIAAIFIAIMVVGYLNKQKKPVE